MEENEYKSTYNDLTSIHCVFEKTLTNNHAKCFLSKHFCLADREGYSCDEPLASSKCTKLLAMLRKKSIFVLKLREVDGPLPHNMEVRVQAGGIKGLAKLLIARNLEVDDAVTVDNISGVIDQAIEKYGSLETLPYSEIVQSVEQFKGRRRRR